MVHSTFVFFFRCLILSRFGYSKEKIVVNDLFRKFSFRYDEPEKSSLLIPLRYFKKSIHLIWQSVESSMKTSSLCLFDSEARFKQEDSEYLKDLGMLDVQFVFRDALPNNISVFSKFLFTVILSIFFLFVFPLSLFYKDRARISLIIVELCELTLLARSLKQCKCKELIILSAFEKDVTLISYFLEKSSSIRVTLVPSANPLKYNYQNVICNRFIITAPFQYEELPDLKINWFVNVIDRWPPFGFSTIKLNEASGLKKPFPLALVSSGVALRFYLKHTHQDSGKDLQADEEMIRAVDRYALEHNISKLLIYLHPLEKNSKENLEFSEKYYRRMIKSNFEFAPLDIKSKQCFGLSDIAISVYSSSQYERLFGGFKTLFAPMGCMINYFKDDVLNKLCVDSYEDLCSLLDQIIPLSDDDFFLEFQLKQYRWDSYTKITNTQNGHL